MKNIKIILGLFLVTTILAGTMVDADSYRGFVDVSLPSWSGKYTSTTTSKEVEGPQYVYKTASTSTNVKARIVQWITTSTSQYSPDVVVGTGSTKSTASTWGNHTTTIYTDYAYQLQLWNSSSSLLSKSFDGWWHLDSRALAD